MKEGLLFSSPFFKTMKKIIEDLKIIKRVFDKYNVRLYLVYGAVLGIYRDGKLLPGDEDIDFCVIDEIDYKTRKAIGWELYYLGFIPQQIAFNVFGRLEQAELGYNGDEKSGIIVCEKNFKYTIFFFKETDCDIHDKEYVCVPKMGAYKLIAIPSRFFEKEKTIKLGGIKFLCPCPIKEYLQFSYEDWKDKTKRDHSPLWNVVHKRYE
jgi:phosphorylcholine metabolism protein LicD